jgi:hypothetical protein
MRIKVALHQGYENVLPQVRYEATFSDGSIVEFAVLVDMNKVAEHLLPKLLKSKHGRATGMFGAIKVARHD